MKYKHSRQELRTWFHINIGFDSIAEKHFEKMLLAQKEDKKECKHQYLLKQNHCYCVVCGKSTKTTPSPLEIEELREVKFGMDSNQTFENFYDAINSLISNQKKLYQFIKEKL